MRIGQREIFLSHTEKLFFPEDGLTKGDIINYYAKIAEAMLPFLRDRLLVMHRFPEGLYGENWIHKEKPAYFPDWIESETIVNEDGTTTAYVICQEAATLVYLANQACLTFHRWLSRRVSLNYPDCIIFDLDPSEDNFETVKRMALELRELLQELGLASLPMTTGSRGMHVLVPLAPRYNFEQTRRFARDVAQILVTRHPESVTIEARKAKRGARLFVDIMRNSFAQTAVAPYSLRGKPHAPVATPLSWDEVQDPALQAQSYNLRNIFARLQKKPNVWGELEKLSQTLEEAQQRLSQLV